MAPLLGITLDLPGRQYLKTFTPKAAAAVLVQFKVASLATLAVNCAICARCKPVRSFFRRVRF